VSGVQPFTLADLKRHVSYPLDKDQDPRVGWVGFELFEHDKALRRDLMRCVHEFAQETDHSSEWCYGLQGRWAHAHVIVPTAPVYPHDKHNTRGYGSVSYDGEKKFPFNPKAEPEPPLHIDTLKELMPSEQGPFDLAFKAYVEVFEWMSNGGARDVDVVDCTQTLPFVQAESHRRPGRGYVFYLFMRGDKRFDGVTSPKAFVERLIQWATDRQALDRDQLECSHCGGFIETEPQHAAWVPRYELLPNGPICDSCAHTEANHSHLQDDMEGKLKEWPMHIWSRAFEPALRAMRFRDLMSDSFDIGADHARQLWVAEDLRARIIKVLSYEGLEVTFVQEGRSQFQNYVSVYVRKRPGAKRQARRAYDAGLLARCLSKFA